LQKNFSKDELTSALSFIRESLETLKLSHRDLMRAELFCEESLLRLIKHSDFSVVNYFRVRIRKSFANILIDLSVPGDKFDFAGSFELPDNGEFVSDDSQEAIQNLLFRSFSDNMTFRHSRGFNTITITAHTSNYASLYKVLAALALAVITSLSMRAFLSDELCIVINSNFFSVISTIFLNGLKMCAVPIVFFSIVLCFADIGNLRGIKGAGTRLFACFAVFQVIAVTLAFAFVFLFGTGEDAGLQLTSGAAQDFSLDFSDTIIALMPNNLIKPFLEGDMLALIVLAVLVGASAGLAGAGSILVFCRELNAIFMKITDLLLKIIPLVVFCSISSMILATGLNTIISLLGMLFTILAAFAVMNVIYSLAVRFIAKLSPSIMYRKSANAIITAFSTCSSNAALPDLMTSAKEMGISSKFYPFAIPVGTSVNKHGFCMYMAVVVLSVANMYGIKITLTQLISMGISIIILIFASPATAGAGPSALSVMFAQFGMPLDLLGPIIAVSAIEDMFDAPVNCIGNVTSTLIAASGENLVDINEYKRI